MSQKLPQLGIGLGLRRPHYSGLLSSLSEYKKDLQWLEVAPENYMDIGGPLYREFCEIAERLPIVFHSVGTSLGSLDPLDRDFLKKLKIFIRKHKIPLASDHICFSSYHGVQFDDLLPLPFTDEAVRHVAKRVCQVQDFLEIPYAVENISYYAPAGAAEMTEWDFVKNVVEESGAWLLLDVNNIYVNSVNFGFDPLDYLKAMPLDRLAYVHIAGHRQVRKNFILDTHGADVIAPVWTILDQLARLAPKIPGIMIERDANIPPLDELLDEVRHMKKILSGRESHVAP
jgi:uncharacterized protein (UPF0276 family)